MEKYKKYLSKDVDVANLYIELATQAVLDYTNRLELLEAMKPLTFELAKHYINEEKDREYLQEVKVLSLLAILIQVPQRAYLLLLDHV